MKLFQLQERLAPKRQDDIVKFAAVSEVMRQDLNKVMDDVDELKDRVKKVIEYLNEEKAKDPAKELQKNPAFKEVYHALKNFIDNRHSPSFLERNPAFTSLRHQYHMLVNKVIALERALGSSSEPGESPAAGVQRDMWQQSMANTTMPTLTDISNLDAPTPAYQRRI